MRREVFLAPSVTPPKRSNRARQVGSQHRLMMWPGSYHRLTVDV
jgi:hypothetical protein